MSAESVGEQQDEEEEMVEADVVRDLIIQNNRLQERVDELEDQVEKNAEESLDAAEGRIAMAKLASAVTGRDIPPSNDMVQSSRTILDEFQQLRDDIEGLKEFKESYGSGKARDQDEAWIQIVEFARNVSGNSNYRVQDRSMVALDRDDLAGATGFTVRYCQDLIEKYGDEKEGTDWTEYEPGHAMNNHSTKRKKLLVDMDYWGDGS